MTQSPSAVLGWPKSPEIKNGIDPPLSGSVRASEDARVEVPVAWKTTRPPLAGGLLRRVTCTGAVAPEVLVRRTLQGEYAHVTYRALGLALLLMSITTSIALPSVSEVPP